MTDWRQASTPAFIGRPLYSRSPGSSSAACTDTQVIIAYEIKSLTDYVNRVFKPDYVNQYLKVIIAFSRSHQLFTFLAWMDTAQQTDLLCLSFSLSVHTVRRRSRSNHRQFNTDERGEQKKIKTFLKYRTKSNKNKQIDD